MNTSLAQTIPWNATTSTGELHITKHNSYGASQLKLFEDALQEDTFLMTASYDYGVQHAALIQDMDISWANLRKAIRTILYHSLFGQPLISVPVCGSTDNYDAQAHEKVSECDFCQNVLKGDCIIRNPLEFLNRFS